MSGILLVCSGCDRHVKNGDCLCPFCGTKVACVAGPAAKAPPGISRGAILALGAAGALTTAMASCSVAVYGGPATGGGGYGGEGQTSTGTAQTSTGTAQTTTGTGQGGAGGEMPDAGKD